MAIDKQPYEIMKHRGIDAESSEADTPEGFFEELLNVEINRDGVLSKRKGYVQVGNVLSTTPVYQLDRYVTENAQTLIASVDKKLFYLSDIVVATTTLATSQVFTSITDVDLSTGVGTLNKGSALTFTYLDGDNIVLKIGSDEYYLLYSSTLPSNDGIRVDGVTQELVDALTLAGTSTAYVGRVSDTFIVVSSTGFVAGDMITVEGFNRNFKVVSVGTGTIQVDEEVLWNDSSSGVDIEIAESWEQFLKTDGVIPTDTPFDATSTQNYVSSTMLRKSLILTDGENEPFKYDGTEITRLGFHGVPDILDDISILSGVTGNLVQGNYSYSYTYGVYDNNGEFVESEASYKMPFTFSDATNRDILIPIIPIAYGVNNNLMYNIDRCIITLYRTEDEGTDYYKSTEVAMNTLGAFHISSITIPVAGTMRCTLSGSPDISKLAIGDYYYIKNCKDAGNNGFFPLTAIDNSAKWIELTNAGVVADSTGTSVRGMAVSCIRDQVPDTTLVENSLLYNNKGVEDDNDAPPLSKYTTTFDNRVWMANGKTYQEQYVEVDSTVEGGLVATDTFSITNGTITETYEWVGAAANASTGNVRLDLASSTSYYEMIRILCDAINAKADGLCYAYYQKVSGGGFILRERQRNTATLGCKFNFSTASLMSNVKIGDLFLNSSYDNVYVDFTTTRYGSRLWWSKDGQPASYVGTFNLGVVDSVFYEDVAPDNGQEITGMIPSTNFMVVFKEDSCFRVSKTGQDAYLVELIDASVGCIAPKTIVDANGRIMFLSRYGVYETDGFYAKPVGRKVTREWDIMNKSLMPLACASNNVAAQQLWFNIPQDTTDEVATNNNVILVYDYDKDNWYKFDNFPATMYTKIDATVYFSTINGKVFTLRDSGDSSDYRDDASAIEATITTRWMDMGSKSARKMFMNLITHLYQTKTSSSAEVSYSYDLRDGFTDLGTVSISASPWGRFPWAGGSSWGSLQIKPVKKPLRPTKANYMQVKYYNGDIDTALQIQGFTIEFKGLNTQAVQQEDR